MPPELTQKVRQLIEANQINDKVIAALQQNSALGQLLAFDELDPQGGDQVAIGHRRQHVERQQHGEEPDRSAFPGADRHGFHQIRSEAFA